MLSVFGEPLSAGELFKRLSLGTPANTGTSGFIGTYRRPKSSASCARLNVRAIRESSGEFEPFVSEWSQLPEELEWHVWCQLLQERRPIALKVLPSPPPPSRPPPSPSAEDLAALRDEPAKLREVTSRDVTIPPNVASATADTLPPGCCSEEELAVLRAHGGGPISERLARKVHQALEREGSAGRGDAALLEAWRRALQDPRSKEVALGHTPGLRGGVIASHRKPSARRRQRAEPPPDRQASSTAPKRRKAVAPAPVASAPESPSLADDVKVSVGGEADEANEGGAVASSAPSPAPPPAPPPMPPPSPPPPLEQLAEAPADATAALMAAIGQYSGKAKLTEMHFAALTEATRAADVDCTPLTAESDLPAIDAACKALGRALGALDDRKMDKPTKTQRTALKGVLDFPSPQPKAAFKAHLRAEAAQAAQTGGGLVEKAVEAELAARRETVVIALIQPAAAPAHVKMKDLFRRFRDAYTDAWVASCGAALLERANAALEETEAGKRREIPKAVVDKWQQALLAVHGDGCKFKDRTVIKPPIKGNHLYKFELAGTAQPAPPAPPAPPRARSPSNQLRLPHLPHHATAQPTRQAPPPRASTSGRSSRSSEGRRSPAGSLRPRGAAGPSAGLSESSPRTAIVTPPVVSGHASYRVRR